MPELQKFKEATRYYPTVNDVEELFEKEPYNNK
jgi:hypothetical protein